VDAPLNTVYHYRIPPEFSGLVEPGVHVKVPFGPRKINGYVVEVADVCPIEEKRVKDIAQVGEPEERVTPDLLALTEWIAVYYRCGWGEALAAATPSSVRKGVKEKTVLHLSLTAEVEEARAALEFFKKKAKKQAAALEFLLLKATASGLAESFPFAEVETATGASRTAVRALEEKGLVALSPVPLHRELASLAEKSKKIVLTGEQHDAVERICAALSAGKFSPFLLFGVTGSGKTEVYLQALEHALSLNKSALVLVPEISLTPQTVERFRIRAGEVAVLHSHMTDGERAEEWRRLRRGETRVAVGARSAIFAPLDNLGLIIVDEEHERTFKQDNTPRYNARDVALVRARECGAAVVLGSATPSLESWHNAITEKYTLLSLPNRVGGAKPPKTVVVDMKTEWAEVKQMSVFSRELQRSLTLCLAKKEQAIIFLNRRGFHTYVHCASCGEVLGCADCDISLTWHKASEDLRCHYCGLRKPMPKACPSCGATALRQTGTGTERAEDIFRKLFPDARVLRMDSDTMTGRDAHARALSAFARGEYDVLLGTQMIAKGFDFPNVTLVGVLSADGAINLPDFRSAERTFQLITQVVGRAGRADKPGRAVVQAFQPEHYAVQSALAQDFPAFAEKELAERESLGYPPFGRLARIIAKGASPVKIKTLLAQAAEKLKGASRRPLAVLGPVPCPVEKIQKDYRFHILIKARSHREIETMLSACGNELSSGKGVQVAIDIDPLSLL
jgi:primosomal protein N' (replication factor Y)